VYSFLLNHSVRQHDVARIERLSGFIALLLLKQHTVAELIKLAPAEPMIRERKNLNPKRSLVGVPARVIKRSSYELCIEQLSFGTGHKHSIRPVYLPWLAQFGLKLTNRGRFEFRGKRRVSDRISVLPRHQDFRGSIGRLNSSPTRERL
jgi:hypothetical protein